MDSKRIHLMRVVDNYVGIPLCYLLRCFDLVARLFRKHQSTSPQKILLLKPSEMGALFHIAFLIKKIQSKYPDAEIFVLTFKKNAVVFDLLEIIPRGNVLTIRSYSPISFIVDIVRFLRRAHTMKIDTVYDLEFFARFTAILTYLTGAQNRIGFSRYGLEGLYRGDLFTKEVPYNPYFHIREMYDIFSSVDVCGESAVIPMDPYVSDSMNGKNILRLSDESRLKAKKIIHDLTEGVPSKTVLVYPGNGQLALREWDLSHLTRLVKMLIAEQGIRVAIIGCKNTKKRGDALAREVDHSHCINLAGQMKLEEVCALFEESTLFIGSDCGLAHLASLTSIYQIILFGPETPAVFGPVGKHAITLYKKLPCSPCFSILNHRRSLCRDNKCLTLITPEEVFAVALKQLQNIT